MPLSNGRALRMVNGLNCGRACRLALPTLLVDFTEDVSALLPFDRLCRTG